MGDNVLDEYYTWPTELVAVLYPKKVLLGLQLDMAS